MNITHFQQATTADDKSKLKKLGKKKPQSTHLIEKFFQQNDCMERLWD